MIEQALAIWVRAYDLPHTTISQTLAPFYDLDVRECNGNFQHLLVQKIIDAGKPIDDLTVGELRALVETARAEFNVLWNYWHPEYAKAAGASK
jgi:hypothetical protein